MDFMDMLEVGIPSNVDIKKNNSQIYNSPVLFSTSPHNKDISITFIIDRPLFPIELDYLKKIIVNNKIYDFQILLPTNVRIDSKKNENNQYIDYAWDFEKYIKPWSKIITFGKAMFSICKSTDLDCSVKGLEDTKDRNIEKNSIIEGFYDTLLKESHFFDPKTKCIIFPVDSWDTLIHKDKKLLADSFEVKFFKIQLQRLQNFNNQLVKIKKINYTILTNPNEWMIEQIRKYPKNTIIAWDLETGGKTEDGGLDPFAMDGEVRCFTCAFYDNPYNGFYAEFSLIDNKILEQFLLHFKHLGSNLNFDYKWLVIKKGLSIKIVNNLIYDTIHISQILNTNQRNSLKSNVWVYSYYGGYDKPLEDYKKTHSECKKNYGKIPQEILVPYATQDPCVSILVHKKQEELIHEIDRKYPITFIPNSKWSMWRFYTELRIPTQRVFTKAEIRGIEVNWNKVEYVSNYLKNLLSEYEIKIKKALHITDENFNISSNDQLGKQIELIGAKCYGTSKKGLYLVNGVTLNKWIEDGHDWAKLIEEYHSISTIYRTFVGNKEDNNGYFQYRKFDNKVHSTFGVGLNNTGRNNSKNPNLQNLPKHGFLAFEARDFFTPEDIDHCAIVESDGASLQLRIEASLSRDKRMTKLFQKGIDMHTVTAHFLFGKGMTFEEFNKKVEEGDKKYKKWRQASKGPNFSLCFNTTANAFAKTTLYEGSAYKWTLDQAKEYIHLNNLEKERIKTFQRLQDNPLPGIDNIEVYSYFLTCATHIREQWLNKYDGIKHFIEYKITEGQQFGACFTPFGFVRRVPLLKWGYNEDDNKAKIKNAENIVSNVGAQTMEWVMISKTMIAIDNLIEEKNYKSSIVGNVHDSIVQKIYYDEAYDILTTASKVFCEDIPENNNVPYGLEHEIGIWGFGVEFTLDELKNPEVIKTKVKEHIEKLRKESLFKDMKNA